MEVDEYEAVAVAEAESSHNSPNTVQEEDEVSEESISAPTSRTEYSSAISGFLILNWRSPLTPSHVSSF